MFPGPLQHEGVWVCSVMLQCSGQCCLEKIKDVVWYVYYIYEISISVITFYTRYHSINQKYFTNSISRVPMVRQGMAMPSGTVVTRRALFVLSEYCGYRTSCLMSLMRQILLTNVRTGVIFIYMDVIFHLL